MGTPFKMKGSPMMRNFGAPFKNDTTQKVTTGTSKNIHNPGPTTKVTTTTPKGTSYVETSNKTGKVVSEGSGNAKTSSKSSKPSAKPNTDLTKRQDVTKAVKNFNTTGTSKAGKIAQYLGKGSKFLLGKGLGIAGVILGSTTTATADQPTKGKGKREYEGGEIDFSKQK
tara:strand:+ start:35 stop:541 length:507 start_codon:yes stop_codon:yes gene_type:complete